MASFKCSALLLLLAVGGALASRNAERAETYSKEPYGSGPSYGQQPPYGGPSYGSYPHPPPVIHPGGCTCNCNMTVVTEPGNNETCPDNGVKCPDTQILCDDKCVDMDSPDHCGSCTPCGEDHICVVQADRIVGRRNARSRAASVSIAATKKKTAPVKKGAAAKKTHSKRSTHRSHPIFKRVGGMTMQFQCVDCLFETETCLPDDDRCCTGFVCDPILEACVAEEAPCTETGGTCTGTAGSLTDTCCNGSECREGTCTTCKAQGVTCGPGVGNTGECCNGLECTNNQGTKTCELAPLR